ncbi:hypothetical protein M5689_024791 [Euphorbia peplus]|nr:hypothetical protein M5689_024791 [Euphorbia peplus]
MNFASAVSCVLMFQVGFKLRSHGLDFINLMMRVWVVILRLLSLIRQPSSTSCLFLLDFDPYTSKLPKDSSMVDKYL